jgi:adenosylcobyric acid synthase
VRREARGTADGDERLDVAVIRLPHIANFDDFDLLACHPSVTLRYVDSCEALGTPDLIVLPGTKTTRADLAFLWRTGLGREIQEHARREGAVLGICGGFQMLGRQIDDPSGVEGPAGRSDGLGLLEVMTKFAPKKATAQVQGWLKPSRGLFEHGADAAFTGYEIHMGQTHVGSEPLASIQAGDGATGHDGAVSPDGWVVGTYVHGLLKNANVVAALVANLAARRGSRAAAAPQPSDPYDRLADVLRRSLNIPLLRQLAGLG